jgi:uncharacterized protein YcbX
VTLGYVDGLWRYPVKSMRGQELRCVTVGERGLHRDRAYAVIDRASGKVASAKHPRLWGRLLACHAVVEPAPDATATDAGVRITLPDGDAVTAGTRRADAALSALLDRHVTLACKVPGIAEIDRYWPDVDGLALRDMITSGEIGSGAPPGTFFDYAPVHLLTTTTLDHLAALYPDGHVDARRFRANLVIAPGDARSDFIENSWVGRTLLVGDEVRLRVIDPSPRCVVPTLAQADLPPDIGILRTIARHNRPPISALGGAPLPSLGVYAVVERGGVIRRGDAVRPGWA